MSHIALVANNPTAAEPYIHTRTTPTRGANHRSVAFLSIGETKLLDDGLAAVNVSRVSDIDSGHWYQANHKNMYAEITDIPSTTWDPDNEQRIPPQIGR